MEMATKTTVAETMAEDRMDTIAADATEEDSTEMVTTDISGRVLDLTRHGHRASSRTVHPSASVFKTVVNVSGALNVETRDFGQLRTALLLTLKVSRKRKLKLQLQFKIQGAIWGRSQHQRRVDSQHGIVACNNQFIQSDSARIKTFCKETKEEIQKVQATHHQ